MVWIRAVSVWLLLIGAEVVNGTVRVLVLEPRLGDFRARQLGVFTGSALILTLTYTCIPWIRARSSRQLLAIGALWVSLTLPFEIGLGRLSGNSWQRIGSDFDLSHGGLLPLGLLVMLCAPLIATRIRRPPTE
jgi:hypothetical protein